MRTSKYANDSKRMAFREYLLTQKKTTTALGYLSSLSRESFVSEIAEHKFHVSDIFDIRDIKTLGALYQEVVKDERNRLSHSRYSAALNFYIAYMGWNKIMKK